MKVKIVIEMTREEAEELQTDLYQNGHEWQDTPLGKLWKDLDDLL